MAIITISRGSFAGGRAVARQLSERLHHPTLSREDVLAQAAQEYGIHERDLAKAFEDSPPFWHQVPGKRLAYVKCVTAVVLDHVSQGNLVYDGYVGHLLLTGVSHVIRVRVIADLEYRVAAAMAEAHWRREQALAHLQQVDEERRRWARCLYGVDWEEPTQYSAILNVSQLAVGDAVELIAQMAGFEAFQPTPESQRRFAELHLSARVWGALAKNRATRSTGLEVTARDGEVLIRGTAGSAKALELIPAIAGAIPGVTAVCCEAVTGTDWPW